MATKFIHRVDLVQLAVLESQPPQLSIHAKGVVPTGGWTNARLEPCEDEDDQPEDGIYSFNFVATPPEEVAIQVISPIEAYYRINPLPADLKGVKVIASTNSIEQREGIAPPPDASTAPAYPRLEPLQGLACTNQHLKIRVASNGCTRKEDFKINVLESYSGSLPPILEIYRLSPDPCYSIVPGTEELEYTWAELGLTPSSSVEVRNVFTRSWE